MKEKIKNIIFILLLGGISTSLIIGIKSYTLPMIERYEAFQLKSTIVAAAGIAYSKENLNDVFTENIREIIKDAFVFYLSPDNKYIFEFDGRGLWGMIKGVITLNPDLETIERVQIISQEETPGLGARITEERFLNTFRGKKFSPRLKLVLRKMRPEDNEIDAITGATMTSGALIDMLNQAFEDFIHTAHKQKE